MFRGHPSRGVTALSPFPIVMTLVVDYRIPPRWPGSLLTIHGHLNDHLSTLKEGVTPPQRQTFEAPPKNLDLRRLQEPRIVELHKRLRPRRHHHHIVSSLQRSSIEKRYSQLHQMSLLRLLAALSTKPMPNLIRALVVSHNQSLLEL